MKPVAAHPDYESPITLYLDSHIPAKELSAFVRKQAGSWDKNAWPQGCLGDEEKRILLAYDHDLKALHLWAAGTDGTGSMKQLYRLQERLYNAFPIAFESKAVVQIDEFYAVLGDGGCRCELEAVADIINRMLADYPGYLPARLNVVAEQAAKQFNGDVVRLARPDSYDPYVIY